MKLGSAIIFLFLLFRYSQAGLTYFRGTECDLDLFRDRSAYFFNRCGVVRIRIEQQTYTQFNEKVTELLSRPCNNSIDGNVKPFVYDEAKLLLVNYDRADHDIRTCLLDVNDDDKDTFLYGAQEWRHLTRQLEYSEMEDKYIYKIDDNGEYACNPGGAFYDHCEKRLYMDLIFPWTSETRGNIKDNFNSVYEVNPDGNVVVRQTASILSECKKKSEITDWLIDYTWTSNKDLGQFFNQLYDGVSLKAMKKHGSTEFTLYAIIPIRFGQPTTRLYKNEACTFRETKMAQTKEFPRMLLLPHSRTDRLIAPTPDKQEYPKEHILRNYTNENTAPLCNYSLFANDYLHVFTPCGIIRLEMSTIRSKEMLDVHIKQFKLLSEETCKGRTPRKNVKPFYYRPEELLLATWNDDNEIELAYIKVDTESSKFLPYPEEWSQSGLQMRTINHKGKMNDDGNVCDFEHSVYFSLKKIWRIDNKDVPAYKGKSLYHNELIKNSECPNYASNLELQNDPTIYQSSMNIQKPVVGEGYPRKMAFNNLHYDSTRQMTVLNVETNSYDQLIFYPSNFSDYDKRMRGTPIAYTFDKVCRIRTAKSGENPRFMLLPLTYDELILKS